MKVKSNIPYKYVESYGRLEEIIDSTEVFEKVSVVPNSESLTYKNGYYIDCYSIFIDIRESSKLPDKYQRPTLAKIYRAYISEIVAIFQSYQECKEINIVGDSVWAIFEANTKIDVLKVFSAAYTSQSLIHFLNYKLENKKIDQIKTGIGISKGRALMIKAGFKGSGINDIIYMGQVVNRASKLCSKANKDVQYGLVIDNDTYNALEGYDNDLGSLYQDMFEKSPEDYYYGTIIRVDMDQWLAMKQK
ncbi:adenylate/guanylate cyclase domain-containing protein [Myroides odoratimimus]|uniref:adenylate/guanylate cyclase domain-containing protein n=1 Tax=Myroides odoratimimus TaxID=76832 RepID=UPI0031015E6B